ncbi:hypothetical protein HI914_05193 [Erysiphe necator]|nr:hypothetical protein HI914_05193 [Erysiphe necator]
MTYIAKEAFVFRIRLIAFRSEQTACYAATSYRSLPNEPGIFLVVGGLGILQTMPGTGNGYINSFSLPILAISYETYLTRKSITNTFRASCYGSIKPAFIDLPANVVKEERMSNFTTVIHPLSRKTSDLIKLIYDDPHKVSNDTI